MQTTRPTLRRVSQEVHATICKLVADGADRQEISLALLAYALNLEFEARGGDHVVNHLRRIARKFELGDMLASDEIACLETGQRDDRKAA